MISIAIPLEMYALIGVIISFCKLKPSERKVFLLTDYLERIIPSRSTRLVVEIFAFTIFGYILSMGLVHPQTEMQAFTAGLAWTGITAVK